MSTTKICVVLAILSAVAGMVLTVKDVPARPLLAVGPQYDTTHVYVTLKVLSRLLAGPNRKEV
jgi:hypothetical protein